MNIYCSPPATPLTGDMLYSSVTNHFQAYDGTGWVTVTTPPRCDHVSPTENELEKYPALKEAWEQYLTIRTLCGH